LDSEDVARKISFRYLSVPFTDGFMNMFMQKSNEGYINVIIELNNFSNNIFTTGVK